MIALPHVAGRYHNLMSTPGKFAGQKGDLKFRPTRRPSRRLIQNQMRGAR